MTLNEWRSKYTEENSQLLYGYNSGCDQMKLVEQAGYLFVAPDAEGDTARDFVRVAGTHRSKSVLLPVYRWSTAEYRITLRGNFYNWNCSVESEKAIELPTYFDIDSGSEYLFCEGMEDSKLGPYSADPKRFSFCVWSGNQLYAILWCISSQVEKAK